MSAAGRTRSVIEVGVRVLRAGWRAAWMIAINLALWGALVVCFSLFDGQGPTASPTTSVSEARWNIATLVAITQLSLLKAWVMFWRSRHAIDWIGASYIATNAALGLVSLVLLIYTFWPVLLFRRLHLDFVLVEVSASPLQAFLRFGLLPILVWGTVATIAASAEQVVPGRPPMPELILSAITAAMPVVVANDRGTIISVSPPAADLIGGAIDDIQGLNLLAIMPARYRPAHVAGLRRYLATGVGPIVDRVVPVDVLRRDGTEVPVSLALTVAQVEDRRYFVGALWRRADA